MYEAPQEEELDDFCGEKLRWCAAVTCGGDVVAENTCSKDGNSYSVVCSCGDGQASVTQTSSSSFSSASLLLSSFPLLKTLMIPSVRLRCSAVPGSWALSARSRCAFL